VPRIDRKVIQQYKEDIIVLSGNLNGEIPNKILNLGENRRGLVVERTVPGRLLYGGDASQSRG
jgi:DNA polymerase III alpha subunit